MSSEETDRHDVSGVLPRQVREELATRLRGSFIVLDGSDGSGKSTQARRLERFLREAGADVARVREPGTTPIGEAVRSIVLNESFDEMSIRCELFLFMASRAQLAREIILPALKDGYTVIADRFLASSLAYQAGMKSLEREYGFEYMPIKQIDAIGRIALGPKFPQFKTFVFDIDVSTGIRRMHSGEITRHGTRSLHAGDTAQLFLFGDRMEYRAARYQLKVGEMFKWLVKNRPEEYIRINANGTQDVVFERLVKELCHSFHVRASRSTVRHSDTGERESAPIESD